MMPTAMVMSVISAPTRKYSMNPISTVRLACCTTIRLATEPMSVRFPASVLLMASASQKSWPSAERRSERLEQHDRGHIADQVGQNGGDSGQSRDPARGRT